MGAFILAYGACQAVFKLCTSLDVHELREAVQATTSTLGVFVRIKIGILNRDIYWWRVKMAFFHGIMITYFIVRALSRWIIITLRIMTSVAILLLGRHATAILYWIAIFSSVMGLMVVEFLHLIQVGQNMHFIRRGSDDRDSIKYF